MSLRWLRIVLGVGWMLLLTSCASTEPRLEPDSTVAADFAALAHGVFSQFAASFPQQQHCIGTVSLAAADELDDLATYDPATATVTVRVPGPVTRLEEAVVHELAHHLEFSCDAHHAMRPAFLAALGRDPETPWFAGEEPEDIPSEVFAEAVVEIVLEDFGMVHTGIGLIPTDAVEVVMDWGHSTARTDR